MAPRAREEDVGGLHRSLVICLRSSAWSEPPGSGQANRRTGPLVLAVARPSGIWRCCFPGLEAGLIPFGIPGRPETEHAAGRVKHMSARDLDTVRKEPALSCDQEIGELL